MSNREASRVYELIVESVINEVREDFENAGIDEQTLQDLRKNWQLRLSESKVSSFSWDEYSIIDGNNNNNQSITNGTTGLSIDTNNNNSVVNSNVNDVLNNEIADQNLNEFNIKQENSNDLYPNLSQGLVLPGFDSNSIPTPPQQTSTVLNVNTSDNSNSNDNKIPLIKEEEGLDNQSKLPDTLYEQNNTETNSNNDNVNSGNIKIEETQRSTNLDNVPLVATNGKIELTLEDPNGTVEEQLKLQEKKAKRSALLDTDEVGSELDDSDDDYLISEGDDDGPDENLVLCLYDKVTRTKARWKCSLKDGIATINHRDYTFQKAQVDAEWV